MTLLNPGDPFPRLTIDTSMEVYGLRAIENTVAVIGYEKVITWDLSGVDPPHARLNIEDSSRTIDFDGMGDHHVFAASISLDFRYVAFIKNARGSGPAEFLDVYCTSTRQNLQVIVPWASALWFAPDGHDIWCVTEDGLRAIPIPQEALGPTETMDAVEDGPWGCPWGSSYGYKIADDGGILGVGGKRLLMLPPIWRSKFRDERVWNGKFLALLYGTLPEPVILELEP